MKNLKKIIDLVISSVCRICIARSVFKHKLSREISCANIIAKSTTMIMKSIKVAEKIIFIPIQILVNIPFDYPVMSFRLPPNTTIPFVSCAIPGIK